MHSWQKKKGIHGSRQLFQYYLADIHSLSCRYNKREISFSKERQMSIHTEPAMYKRRPQNFDRTSNIFCAAEFSASFTLDIKSPIVTKVPFSVSTWTEQTNFLSCAGPSSFSNLKNNPISYQTHYVYMWYPRLKYCLLEKIKILQQIVSIAIPYIPTETFVVLYMPLGGLVTCGSRPRFQKMVLHPRPRLVSDR